jgi:hypothetical protein
MTTLSIVVGLVSCFVQSPTLFLVFFIGFVVGYGTVVGVDGSPWDVELRSLIFHREDKGDQNHVRI